LNTIHRHHTFGKHMLIIPCLVPVKNMKGQVGKLAFAQLVEMCHPLDPIF
jgi:hypothetical protein